MTKKEILAGMRSCAQKLGRAPKYAELRRMTNINRYWIHKYFFHTAHAFREAGIALVGGGHRIETATLLEDWARVAHELKKLPTQTEYNTAGRFNARTFVYRYKSWTRMPDLFRAFVRKCGNEERWADVLALIQPQKKTGTAPAVKAAETEGDDIQLLADGQRVRKKLRFDRPTYGAPSALSGLRYEPVNEMGVIFVFGMVAGRLGIHVERLQPEFPDCEAMREVEPGRWQRIRIEFEFASRSFKEHKHPGKGCDLLICWTHNWPECPEDLEVIELKGVVRGM
jgi:hypothetical protein